MHPQAESAPQGKARVQCFEEIAEMWTVGEVIWVVLACVWRATTKKGRQLFGQEKCTPRQNPGYAYV